jgi:hypothetical protein
MAILNIVTSQTGLVGVVPRVIFINTNDTAARVETSGYLTKSTSQGYAYSNKDMALVSTTDGLLWMDVVITPGNVSLVPNGNSITSRNIQDSSFTYAPDTGLADAYIVNLVPAFNPLTEGSLFYTTFASDNTGASTVQVNGATYDLLDMDGSSLGAGAILTGQFGIMAFDGTNVQLLNSALTGALSVTPPEIQSQEFTYAVDSSAAPEMQVIFDSATTGNILNGAGAINGLTTYMSIRQLS